MLQVFKVLIDISFTFYGTFSKTIKLCHIRLYAKHAYTQTKKDVKRNFNDVVVYSSYTHVS